MNITPDEWKEARAAIESASEIVLACHQGPDGDALGSMLALQLALKDRGVKAVASWGSEPFVVPKHYTFLPGLDGLTPPGEVTPNPELMVTFDCGSFERLGTLEPNAKAAQRLICVDHHATNERFGTINLIDPTIAASAALTYRLILELGIPLTRDIATCLYTGILTDTGCFKYRNTTSEIHAIAGDLLEHGVPHDEIARIVYDTHPVGYLKVLATALERAELIPDADMIWTWVTRSDLERNAIDPEDTDGLIDEIRKADAAEVAAVLKELPEGNYKVSMRAKTTADVGALCESFGGGGHALAAGFTADGRDPRAIAESIAERLRAASAG